MAQEDSDRPKIRIVKVSGDPEKVRDDSAEAVTERLLKRPTTIHLFTDWPDPIFDLERLADYLRSAFGPNFTVRRMGEIADFTQEGDLQSLAEANFGRRGRYYPLTLEEKVAFERETQGHSRLGQFRDFARDYAWERLRKQPSATQPILNIDYYNTTSLGVAYLNILKEVVPSATPTEAHTILIVTGRGIGGKEGEGIHMRAGFMLGQVTVVSTTGLVDAPGRPQEVDYILQNGGLGFTNPERFEAFRKILREKYNNTLNGDIMQQIIAEVYKDKMLSYGDPRLNEAVKGLSLSGTIFSLGEYGKAFRCSSSDLYSGQPDITKFCRLHDAHWQEEVISTQIKEPGQSEFCDYHQDILTKLQSYRK